MGGGACVACLDGEALISTGEVLREAKGAAGDGGVHDAGAGGIGDGEIPCAAALDGAVGDADGAIEAVGVGDACIAEIDGAFTQFVGAAEVGGAVAVDAVDDAVGQGEAADAEPTDGEVVEVIELHP